MDSVVDRLAAVPIIARVPRAELEWLAARGELRDIPAGSMLFDLGSPIDEMFVVLTGGTAVHTNTGGAWRKANVSGSLRLNGAIPFSRGRVAPLRVVVEDDATCLVVHRRHFAELIRDCPELTATLVHEMIDRARAGKVSQMHDERLYSMGRLAAGLAHELNNPASAASRVAQSLPEVLDSADAAARDLAKARLDDAQFEAIDAVRAACAAPSSPRGALELMDRESGIAEWLERHGLESSVADAFTATNVEVADLDGLAGAVPAAVLGATIRWLASGQAARAGAHQIGAATARIHDLVATVRRFTYMDRELVPGEVDVSQGLTDALTVLANKSKALSVEMRLEIPPHLPAVHGYGSEINQVWEKLIDNAIDAAGRNGQVTIAAVPRGDSVVVSVTDNGPGISEEDRLRVFDPFFTTKPAGQGVGLGLDLVRRVVHAHQGDIDFASQPGRTVFSVRLPRTAMSSASPPSAV